MTYWSSSVFASLLALACGCSDGSAASGAQSTSGTGGGASLAGTGGALSGSGGSSTGGTSGPGSGGAYSTGGQSTGVVCLTETGELVPEAKACETSADCEAVPTYSCCGPGVIVGLAKQAPEYKACFTTNYPQDCPPLGCASFASTEDGSSPEGSGVLARCLEGACMTSPCKDKAECGEGDTCNNGCGQPCACDGGLLACAKPEVGGACPMNGSACAYVDDPSAETPSGETCVCNTGLWQCTAY